MLCPAAASAGTVTHNSQICSCDRILLARLSCSVAVTITYDLLRIGGDDYTEGSVWSEGLTSTVENSSLSLDSLRNLKPTFFGFHIENASGPVTSLEATNILPDRSLQ